MAGFEAWNKAVAAYFTAGAAKGSPIFLSLDLEAIEDVATRFIEERVEGDAQRDFVSAVRRRCISASGEHVNIEVLGRRTESARPKEWVGRLAARRAVCCRLPIPQLSGCRGRAATTPSDILGGSKDAFDKWLILEPSSSFGRQPKRMPAWERSRPRVSAPT
jgi:hypothetical protein